MPHGETQSDRSAAPPRSSSGLILGIESSCDETAAAVVRRGTDTLSNVIASQIALHATYGGVVPELASREHLRNIVPVTRAALREAGIGFGDLDAIAVTRGPGLAGALLVGMTYAKALAFALGKPLLGINHLEGHIHAVLMEHAAAVPAVDTGRPLLALVVSGGHTHLYLAKRATETGAWSYRNVGRTVDDAAGEAYDKVAKLLGFGYPGGPWIDRLSPLGDPRAVPFSFSPIKPSRSEPAPPPEPRYDFSFSGIKTAVLRYTQNSNMAAAIEPRRRLFAADPELRPTPERIAAMQAEGLLDRQTLDLLASFQHAVVGVLVKQTLAAARSFRAGGILVSGGVAANAELRRRFTAEAARIGLPVAFPSLALSTDNAAMIAAAAWPRLLSGDFAAPDLAAEPQLRLG